MRFGEGLCLPSHAALTRTGAQGFRPGKGRRGSEGGGRTRNVAVWLGVGRMLRSGCCLDLKSHLVVSLSPDPEGGSGTGGRGWWDVLNLKDGEPGLAN